MSLIGKTTEMQALSNIRKLEPHEFFAGFQEIVSEIQGSAIDFVISDRTLIAEEIGLDSLSRVELISKLEDKFHRKINGEEALLVKEVGALRKLFEVELDDSVDLRPGLTGTSGAKQRQACPESVQTLTDALLWQAEKSPELEHVIWVAESHLPPITFGALASKAEDAAAGLLSRGIGRGDRVALMLPTGEDLLVSFFAVLLAGAVPVPLYPPHDLSRLSEHISKQIRILQNCGAKLLICPKDARGFEATTTRNAPALEAFVEPGEIVSPGVSSRSSSSARRVIPRSAAQDLALLQYTSGSTGDPKGVALTHYNLLSNIKSMRSVAQVSNSDVFVSWLPLYHDMGLIGAWLGSLFCGIPLVLMSPLHFLARPARWLRAISDNRATLSAGPNFAYQLCVDRLKPDELQGLDLSTWRVAFNGAEPVSAATLRAFSEKFSPCGFDARALTPVYGLAENSLGVLFPPLGRGPKIDRVRRSILQRDAIAEIAAPGDLDATEIPSCGMPIPDNEVRIIDSSGRTLPPRVVGLLQFKGPSASAGYFDNPAATANLIAGEWRNSGDFAYQAEGEFYITGRQKDLIIRAGRNIYPQEIEEQVARINGVRKGCIAAFAAIDHDLGTEKLIVAAETKLSNVQEREALVREIKAAVAQLVESPPDEVLLLAPRAIPKTSSGKLRRSECRKRYESGALSAGRSRYGQLAAIIIDESTARMLAALRKFASLLRGIWAWSAFVSMALAAFAVCIAMPQVSMRRKAVRAFARGALFIAGIRLKCEGLENCRHPKALVAVSNHASYLDAILLTAALPPIYAFVAKRDFMNAKAMHYLLRLLGTKFVERFDASQSVRDTEELAAVAQNGEHLLFFPEGTFHRAAGVLPFKMGAFVLAARSGLSVLPISLNGSRLIMRDGSWIPKMGQVRVVVSEAIAASGDSWNSALKLRDQVRAKVVAECGEIDTLAGAKESVQGE